MKRQSKKRLSLMLTAMMLLSNISYASNDINGHWASETMARWQSQGLIKGDEKGNLNPDKSITRAEFITIVNKAMEYNKTGDKIKNYKDLKQNDWYYSQIMTALEQGYINGTSNDTMSPNKDITRQEVMVIINNIAGLKQSKFDLSAVKDQDKIASWAKNAATNMIANGYITGYQGKINPNKAMKRAEAITLLDAYKQNNRTISFQGQYSLGKANKVTLLTGNIQINDSQIKELIINKDTQGKIELTNTSIEKITNNSKEIKIYLQGKEVEIKDGKIIEQQTTQDKKYKDGKYTGKAKGYKSDVEVEVEIKDGKIVKIDVKQQEDPLYWNVAKTVIDRILQKQTPQVDASTGATITSKAIMYAVEEALEKALIKKQEIQGNKELKDGKYIGQATGYRGIMRVEVEIKDGKIVEITLLSHSDDAGYIDSAKNILKDIKKKQTADVTAISGATFSSDGIKNAVKDALEQAKGKTTKPGESEYAKKNQKAAGGGGGGGGGSSTAKEEKDFTDLVDGIYEGQAKGHYDTLPYSIKVRVTVSNKKIAKIELIENKDDQSYFNQDKADKIAKNIIDKQSTAVDTIAGATRSSTGFINAVANALEFAGKTKIISQDTDGKNKNILTGKITGQNITVKNLTVNEDLTIDKQVGDSNVTLENMEIKGNLLIQGGGANTVHLKDVKVNGRTIIEKIGGQKPRVSVEGQSQLLGKVEIKQVAILQTTDTVKIENVEIVEALNSNDEIQIRANIGKLDIVSINANIKIEKGSKIKQVVLPSEVDKFEKGKGRYEKGNFKLVIEDPSDIEGGTNNKAGEFKFLTNKEISELDNKTYKDGVYFGDGFGFVEAKPIPVKVTVSGGKVSDISIVQEELDKIKNVAHPGKIDDGPAFSYRFDYVSKIVTRDQKPMETAYRLGVIRDAMNKVLSEAKSEDSVDDYNKALDKVIGKHVFSGKKLNPSSLGKIHAELLSLIRTYVIDELGYDRKEYDAVSGATFTGIGTSQAIANALRKADDNIGFYDMRVQDGYAEKFIEDKALDLSSLKVAFYDKGKTSPRIVEYKDFAKNGLKVLFRDTNKEVKEGMILNKENLGYPISNGLTLKVVHEKSNTTKLLRGMSIIKNAVLLKIDKLQVKAKDSNTWLDTTGFDSTVKKGEITYIQHLTLTKEQSDQLLNKEMEFRLITKRADNNQEVVLTTKTVSKYIWNKQTDESFKFHINRDSLKDNHGTKFKVDEIDSDYFVIHFKGNFGGKSISETYTEEPNPITVTTGTILSENILASAFENLPTDSSIKYNQVEANNLTSSVGDDKKLDVTVEFSDKSTKSYQITINVKDKSSLTLAEQYNERPRRITVKVTTNPQLTDEMIRKALPNLPDNTEVELDSALDFSEVGETSAIVNLTFSDDSEKQVEIPIMVRAGGVTLADNFEETENITAIDVAMKVDNEKWKNNPTVKKIMELGGFNEENIEAHIKTLSSKARLGQYGHIVIKPIQTPDMTTVGKSKGRVKLTFKDKSEYEFDMDVNVKPLPIVHFTVRGNLKKKVYNINDTLDFDGMKLLLSLPNEKDGNNKWKNSGPGAYILYDDFKYFGLKVVKTGTNEEVKQGDTVKSALTNGELKLSVISQYGIISTDKNYDKSQEIKGLVLN